MATLTSTPTAHIHLDERGVAYVEDGRFKVIHIVREHLAGSSPQQIHEAYKGVLTLAQVYAALAYYYDHKDQIDQQIRERDELADRTQREAGEHPFVARMRREGRLP